MEIEGEYRHYILKRKVLHGYWSAISLLCVRSLLIDVMWSTAKQDVECAWLAMALLLLFVGVY